MKVSVVKDILAANDRIAQENRAIFDEKNLLVFNLMSSPGAGKTSLLEKTIVALKDQMNLGVIEGDIQSSQDAERIAEKGVPAVQINTGGACHLDGNMIRDTFKEFDLDNLDCWWWKMWAIWFAPRNSRWVKTFKVMILSVTEGEDKPAKYPLMFHESKVLLINKIDLLPYVDCSVERIREEALKVNPELKIFEISCKTGEGLDAWCDWLKGEAESEGLKPFKKKMKRRARGAIEGIVQGVGFRPFIFQLAARYHLSGHVGNTDFGVDLEVEGSNRNVAAFMESVVSSPRPWPTLHRFAGPISLSNTRIPLKSARAKAIGNDRPSFPPTWAFVKTVIGNSWTRRTEDFAIRSSTAPTAAPAIPSSKTSL
jgi:hydrogenase nickel incorporation protein HypB